MASFAEINLENNEVLRVIVVHDMDVQNNGGEKSVQAEQWVKLNHDEDPIIKEKFQGFYPETYWKQCSYNTRIGKYYDINTKELHEDQSRTFRINYPGIGYIYDQSIDGFILPKPYASWSLNTETGTWIAPTPKPTINNQDTEYMWNEENLNWELV
jgi:hypothetical protein